jgi:ABC-type transporter Mla MlaB component
MDSPFMLDMTQDNDTVRLTFSGDLIINYINAINEEVAKFIDYSKNLHIQLSNPTSVDFTFVQIISSLKKTFKSKGKSIQIEAQFSDEISLLISNAGFKDFFN